MRGQHILSVRDSADGAKMYLIHTAVVDKTVKGEGKTRGGKGIASEVLSQGTVRRTRSL